MAQAATWTMLPGGRKDCVVPAFEAGSLGFLVAETFQWLGTLASQDREYERTMCKLSDGRCNCSKRSHDLCFRLRIFVKTRLSIVHTVELD